MAGLVDDFGDSDRGSRARWFQRLAHLLPFAVALLSVLAVVRWFGYLPWMDEAVPSAIVYAIPLLIVVVSDFHVVFARLCIKCMQSMREDAPVRVKRHIWQLWLYHRLFGWRFLIAMAIVSGTIIGIRAVTGWTIEESLPLRIPIDLLLIGTIWSNWIHHRYRPWCPYCKNWGDDGGIHEPSPRPDPSMEKTR